MDDVIIMYSHIILNTNDNTESGHEVILLI